MSTRVHARVRASDGQVCTLVPGDLVGRLAGAALCLDDPRVSEAHALLSLRGEHLVLLALRGLLTVEGLRPAAQAILRPGRRVRLADGVWLDVDRVSLPSRVLAVQVDGHPPLPVQSVISVVTGPPAAAVARFEPGAPLHVWSHGDGHTARFEGGPAQPAEGGQRFVVGGAAVRLVHVPLTGLATADTVVERVDTPLTLIARYDTAHFQREGEATLVLTGRPARVLCELVSFARPVPWELVAREVWSEVADRNALRRVWDRTLWTLRARLREGGLPKDLVHPDSKGNIELVLRPGDRVLDEQ